MDLKDLKDFGFYYDWKTVYVGIQENYFSKEVISQYAIELIESGVEDGFIIDLALGIGEENEELNEIQKRFFSKTSTLNMERELNIEIRKFRFICLMEFKKTSKNDDELLKNITYYYDNNNYPEDMKSFITYMPQDIPTTKKDLIDRFNNFLYAEQNELLDSNQ